MSDNETTFTVPYEDPVVIAQRTFHASRHHVFEALTKPEYVERWYGPRRYKVEVSELDVRPGGRYRFLNIDPDGTVYGFHGEFSEVVPDERLVFTWVYEGDPAQTALETNVLEEHDGRTTLTATAEYADLEARNAVLRAGGNEGAAESWDRLAEVLASMG